MAAAGQSFFPITEISSYSRNWTIHARVTSKSPLRTFNSKSGGQPGTVFSVELLDKLGGEIRANFFAPAEMYEKLVQNKCYTFSKGSVRVANKQYNNLNHRYELTFDKDVQMQELEGEIGAAKLVLTDLRTLLAKTVPCKVDLCGIITGFDTVFAFTSKDGKELVKREITIADDTATSIGITLWGDRAKQEDKVFDSNPVVCLKGVVVKEFNGVRTGSLTQDGDLTIGTSSPEAEKMQQWWSQGGSTQSLTWASLTDIKSVESKTLPCKVDICGIVTSFQQPLSFTSKDGKELVKREITVVDDSAASMGVTLWGDRATQDDKVFENKPVVCIKQIMVKEFNGGRSGSLMQGGQLIFGSTTPDAQRIQQWWEQGGATQSVTELSLQRAGGSGKPTGKPVSLEELRIASEQVLDQPQFFSTICRLAIVQTKKQGETQPLFYTACQEPKEGNGLPCNRRVDESGFCAACGRAGKAAPRFNLRCRFADYGDSLWLTTFHEAAQEVVQKKAEEAQAMEKGEGGREALEAAIRETYFQQPIKVTVRAKMGSYNGEPKTDIGCVEARPVSRGEHGRLMLAEIQEMLAAAPAA